MKLRELVKMSMEERRKACPQYAVLCKECGRPCGGHYSTAKGVACADCHYDAIGELVEQYPIINPLLRRSL